jgi:predicted Zn-dependent protease
MSANRMRAALAAAFVFVSVSALAQGFGGFLKDNLLGNVPFGRQISAVGDAAQALSLTSEQADSIGQSVTMSIAAQNGGVSRDNRLNDYVSLVGMTVVNASPWADRPVHFAVINSPIVNAYSAPNGYVLITTGALAQIQDESELAGVLAHEVGHVVHEHGLAAVRRANLLKAGVTLASTNSSYAQLSGVSDYLVDFLTKQAFDQPAEMEADDSAIQYVTAAGYDPNGYVRFLQRLAVVQAGGGGLFSTHPATADRIKRATANIARSGYDGGGKRLDARFRQYAVR